ncbi:hypothetical protein NY98_11820 [Xanthomonas citri pv. fuscans]|uniref:Secreted protein n=1 Tax=Xanthomonas citri pv. fuscans TaxID=366649 RepID=A0AB34Q6K5_XANCI|nr:hypothetical protein AC613_19290 [Xanthomonas citri pv. fuscans]AZU23058.1 hypothetical protein AC612_19285 [Xanthomonas citri pv. fuscans]AZU94383.1 hypothetical protein AC614_19290 [Xanthomonas citri pv. fuscans]KGU43753.1 hypothetical protein NY97_14915 [Xanthomonas citri pv. fuscans]KGU52669.1 hypothetical protein NY98_11820 [Xanthomonas citri pv. fuscans]
MSGAYFKRILVLTSAVAQSMQYRLAIYWKHCAKLRGVGRWKLLIARECLPPKCFAMPLLRAERNATLLLI